MKWTGVKIKSVDLQLEFVRSLTAKLSSAAPLNQCNFNAFEVWVKVQLLKDGVRITTEVHHKIKFIFIELLIYECSIIWLNVFHS